MRIEKEHGWFPFVQAPECPTIPEVRRVARFFRRGGLTGELRACHPDVRGHAYRGLDFIPGERPDLDEETVLGPPFAYTFTTAHGEHHRILADPYPYAIVDFEAMWEATEAMGFSIACATHGDWDEGRRYEVEAWNPHDPKDRFPFLTGRGDTRVAAMFATVWGLERLTRNWPLSCGRGGMNRPWAHKNRRAA